MNGKDYWVKEALRFMELSLIGVRKKTREHIESAIECLSKHQKGEKK